MNRYIDETQETPFRMNLQLFAAPADGESAQDEASGEAQGTQGAQESQESNQGETSPRSYSEEELQAEIERVVKQRLARQKRDEEKRIAAARAEGRSEAEKLARMTEDQRIEHERQAAEKAAKDRETAIAQREAEITRRELRAEAIDTLIQKGLPRGLEAILNYADADACKASIDSVEKIFRAAVQDAVNERLKASGVYLKNGSNNDYSRMSDADYYAATYKSGKS